MICFIINGPMQHIANQPKQLLLPPPTLPALLPYLMDPNGSTMSRLLATACCGYKCGVVIYQYSNQLRSN